MEYSYFKCKFWILGGIKSIFRWDSSFFEINICYAYNELCFLWVWEDIGSFVWICLIVAMFVSVFIFLSCWIFCFYYSLCEYIEIIVIISVIGRIIEIILDLIEM